MRDKTLVKKGWIQDIVFRGPERPAFCHAVDMDQLQSIRLVTKRAATGSVLALHACNSAGIRTSLLEEPPQASSPLEVRRVDLQEKPWQVQRIYEENVANAVVQLAERMESIARNKC
jgi:hypothetical protein